VWTAELQQAGAAELSVSEVTSGADGSRQSQSAESRPFLRNEANFSNSTKPELESDHPANEPQLEEEPPHPSGRAALSF
jgi:hypothetical protein